MLRRLVWVISLMLGLGIALWWVSPQMEFYPLGRRGGLVEPEWVKIVKQKVDFNRCGPDQCEACSKNRCGDYPDRCRVVYRTYTCGEECKKDITYCVQK